MKLLISNLKSSISRILGTALLEIRLNLSSPAPWVIGLVLAALGYLNVRVAPDASSFPLGWVLSHDLGPLAAVLLLFLAASLAHRPQRYDVAELQDSKLVASEELIFGRWIGMVVALMVPLGVEYAATIAGQMIHSQSPVVPLAYLQSLGRLMPAVLFLSTLSFCLVAITRVLVLGAGLAGLAWFVLQMGQIYYPSTFRMELGQNRFVFMGLTSGMLLLMLAGYRAHRRAKRARVTYALGLATGLTFTVTLIHAAWVSLAIPGKARAAATWQRLKDLPGGGRGFVPNFAWTDLRGRRVSLAGLRGRPALLLFFQPKDGGLTALLGRLARLRQEFGKEGLEVVGVCLSEDLTGAGHAARIAGPEVFRSLPIVTDWGAPAAGTFDPLRPTSAVSRVLRVTATPAALLVDADGRQVARDLPLDEGRWEELKAQIRSQLAGVAPEEPEPQEVAGRTGP